MGDDHPATVERFEHQLLRRLVYQAQAPVGEKAAAARQIGRAEGDFVYALDAHGWIRFDFCVL
jgi:hypothetical protein